MRSAWATTTCPGLVCWALAGERNGTDERMLELLEPYAGQRARVVLLIERAGYPPGASRAAMAPRSIAGTELEPRPLQAAAGGSGSGSSRRLIWTSMRAISSAAAR